MRTYLVFPLLVACTAGAPSTRPTTPPAPPAPAGAPLAQRLAGPFATLEAYCASIASKDADCERVPVEQPTPFLGAELIYRVIESGDIGCALALRTKTGWYVSPPGEQICREPSYREMTGVTIEGLDPDRGLAAVHIGVHWHTKGPARGDGDAEAEYRFTTLCGMVGDVPACTPMFRSRCEQIGTTSECDEGEAETTWKLEGNTVTFDRRQPPTGRHVLLPPPE